MDDVVVIIFTVYSKNKNKGNKWVTEENTSFFHIPLISGPKGNSWGELLPLAPRLSLLRPAVTVLEGARERRCRA